MKGNRVLGNQKMMAEIKNISTGDAWLVQFVECLTLDFSGCEFKSHTRGGDYLKKNSTDGLKSRLGMDEGQISELDELG